MKCIVASQFCLFFFLFFLRFDSVCRCSFFLFFGAETHTVGRPTATVTASDPRSSNAHRWRLPLITPRLPLSTALVGGSIQFDEIDVKAAIKPTCRCVCLFVCLCVSVKGGPYHVSLGPCAAHCCFRLTHTHTRTSAPQRRTCIGFIQHVCETVLSTVHVSETHTRRWFAAQMLQDSHSAKK